MNFKTVLPIAVALLGGLALLVSIVLRTPQPPEHQVFINGDVITMDPDNTIAEALSVRGERIEAIGTTEAIMLSVTDSTVVVDLKGRTLLPGFIDAHGHFPGSGMKVISLDLNSPPIGTVKTMAQVMEIISAQAAQTKPGEWITGFGYDDTLLAEKRHPTRSELDAVSMEHPIAIMHISGHMLVANSMALEAVGINGDTPNPEGGVIGRRPDSNEPNGLLEETARMSVVEKMQDISAVDGYRMFKYASTQYASMGVTTAQSGGVTEGLAGGIKLASRAGVVLPRVVMFPFDMGFEGKLLNGEYDSQDYASDKIIMGPVKLVADGSIQGYTGYLSRPYHVPYHGDEEYQGYPSILRDVLFEKVMAYHKNGYQLAIHGNGDKSIDDILDAFEAAQAAKPVEDPRMILIHAQMARKDQIARMKTLGVTPSFFTAHTWYWGDRHRDIFMGPERAAVMSPSKWAQDAGVRFTSHLDTPVTPMEPLQAVWSVAHRITYGGDVLGPEQRVSVMDALRAVTIDAAWQVFQEDDLGSLEVGKFADLVVLSGNPLDDPMNMRSLKVMQTLVGGATIFERK